MEELKIGWLDKDCIFHSCKYGEHAVLAFKLIKKYKKEVKNGGDWGLCEEGISLGLVCISSTSNYSSVELSKDTSEEQIQWLLDNRSLFSKHMSKTIYMAVNEHKELTEDNDWGIVDGKNITVRFK